MRDSRDPASGSQPRWTLPPVGGDPSSTPTGTTPGSFANPARVGAATAFSSPDTPGMPQPSDKTAWDFLPPGWRRSNGHAVAPEGFIMRRAGPNGLKVSPDRS